MNKRALIYITALLLILVSCGPSSNSSNEKKVFDNAAAVLLKDSIGNIDILDVSAEVKEGQELGVFTYSGGYYYYTLEKVIEMAQAYPTLGIYRVNGKGGAVECVRDLQDSQKHICELCVTGSFIFYEESFSDPIRIIKYDMKSQKEEVIAEYPATEPDPILFADSRFLLWFAAPKDNITLFEYDIETGKTKIIAEHLAAYSAYQRPVIEDGLVSYVLQKDGYRLINAYDLYKDKVEYSLEINDAIKISDVHVNSRYVFFDDGYESTSALYRIDLDSKEFSSVKRSALGGASQFLIRDDQLFTIDTTRQVIYRVSLSKGLVEKAAISKRGTELGVLIPVSEGVLFAVNRVDNSFSVYIFR